LAGRDAAITSAVPGTTRDLIEAPVSIGGVPFVLTDTAGIRDSGDEVEALGIVRAQHAVETADILLWLGPPEDAPREAVVVRSKADLPGADAACDFSVSSVTGYGLDALVRFLLRRAEVVLPVPGEVALHRRHRDALAEACDGLREARHVDLLIAAEGLRRARAALDRVTGHAGVEDMLDALFGRFCIGK
jgi:tRNA modification GTPase